jgi:hypothetical protein
MDQLIGAIAQVSDHRNCSGKKSRTPAETDQLGQADLSPQIGGANGQAYTCAFGFNRTPYAACAREGIPVSNASVQPCRPAITGDSTGAYIVTIVHGERDAPDGARFLHSDVEGEPPGRVTRALRAARRNPI